MPNPAVRRKPAPGPKFALRPDRTGARAARRPEPDVVTRVSCWSHMTFLRAAMPTISRACLPALLLLLFPAAGRPLAAQQDTTTLAVTGVVGDAQSGAPLENALVAIPQLGIRTLTDEAGRFVLFGVPRGEHKWLFRMLGYADWEQEMEVENLERLRVGLLPQPVRLQNITVTADRLAERRKAAGVSVRALAWDEINSVVAATAADVVMRRSPSPATGCPGAIGPIPRPGASANPHPARITPVRERPPLGGASASVGYCIRWRGKVVSPTVYVDDELIPVPLDALHAYAPHEIHTIEYYSFGVGVRVYTVQFVESGKPLLPSGMLFR